MHSNGLIKHILIKLAAFKPDPAKPICLVSPSQSQTSKQLVATHHTRLHATSSCYLLVFSASYPLPVPSFRSLANVIQSYLFTNKLTCFASAMAECDWLAEV